MSQTLISTTGGKRVLEKNSIETNQKCHKMLELYFPYQIIDVEYKKGITDSRKPVVLNAE